MKIVVTGGAGFIGSHVVDAYIKRGHHVAIIDNLKTGFRRNINPRATFYKTDIRNKREVETIFRKERPEIVNHHAAIAEVVKSLRDPLPTLDINVMGTTNILLAFGKYGRGAHKKFLFSSTGGAIYGAPNKIPVNESVPPSPLSPYGLSKLLGEEIISYYGRHFGFERLIFRYGNVYGPRQNPKGEAGVVAIFGGLMKSGKRPTIFGDGTKVRDYIYVSDVVRANTLGLTRGVNGTVNIGTGEKITDQMIFDNIAKWTGFREKPVYAPYRKGEVYRIALNAARAGRILKWKPTISLKEGIRRTLASL